MVNHVELSSSLFNVARAGRVLTTLFRPALHECGQLSTALKSPLLSREKCVKRQFPCIGEICVLTTGNQLFAARGLIRVNQPTLAKLAKVSVFTIKRMEACHAEMLTGNIGSLRRIQAALENLGVELLNEGRPGVRLRAK
jgi:hypothetical protein